MPALVGKMYGTLVVRDVHAQVALTAKQARTQIIQNAKHEVGEAYLGIFSSLVHPGGVFIRVVKSGVCTDFVTRKYS